MGERKLGNRNTKRTKIQNEISSSSWKKEGTYLSNRNSIHCTSNIMKKMLSSRLIIDYLMSMSLCHYRHLQQI